MKIAVLSPTDIETPFPHTFFKADKKLDTKPLEDFDYCLVCGSEALKLLNLGIPFMKAKGCLLRGKYYVTITQETADFTPKKKELLDTAIKLLNDLYKGKSISNKK